MDLDVTDWAAIRPEVGGADQDKVWIAEHPAADRVDQWLWKPRQLTGDGSEAELSDVSEVLCSQMAQLLGLPSAVCIYAVRDGELGVLSKNVSPSDCDLEVGQIYLDSVDGYERRSPEFDSEGRQRGLAGVDVGYTLEAVAEVLQETCGPPGWSNLDGMQVFAGYLVLDALVSNTDRHPRNWALLEPWGNDSRMLAPAFDHGRALGSGLTSANRRMKDPIAFCRKGVARTFTPGDETLVHLAVRAARAYGGDRWFEHLNDLAPDAFEPPLLASQGRLSVEASTFVRKVLEENRRRLCDEYSDRR